MIIPLTLNPQINKLTCETRETFATNLRYVGHFMGVCSTLIVASNITLYAWEMLVYDR